jgi:DNA-binding transcriptional LysR family regulator
MNRDLNSSLLRTLLMVVETGSVSNAAQALHRTQAAVSMALRRLEEEVGQRLLERSPRGVKLTAAGSILIPYARRILGTGVAARAALNAGQVSGTVRLGILEDIAVGQLQHALRRFAASFPNVALEIMVDSSPELSRGLANGALDFVIGDPTLINAEPLAVWQHPLSWAAGLTYGGDARREPLPVVGFGGVCPWQDKLFASLRQAGIAWKVVCISTSLSAIQSAVEAGLGVAVLLDWNIRPDSMQVLEPSATGLPRPPLADFGLFSRADESDSTSAVQILQHFLFYELRLGSREEIAGEDVDGEAVEKYLRMAV